VSEQGPSAGFRDFLESAAAPGAFDAPEGIRVGGGGRRQDGVAWAR
jgi:hypothetical protein